jgi:hypothetical protein
VNSSRGAAPRPQTNHIPAAATAAAPDLIGQDFTADAPGA